MNFINTLMAKTKASTITTDKIKWIAIDKITINPKIKSIFDQGETEITNICEDMKLNGYNAGNPATVSQDGVLVEGHTRYLAAQRTGLKKIAVVYKHFKSEEEMIEYAYNQQLHRRNLSEQKIFNAYKQLRELTNADGKKAKTDVQIAEELNISPRQIAKMKEEIKPAEEKVELQEEVTTETTSVEVTPVKPKKTLSVAEYVMNLVMSTVKTTPATDSVSEQETA